MDPCKERDPIVIDNNLLEKCIIKQGPKGEAGRLAVEEGIPIDEVEQLKLEFMNIVRMDHLWVMTNIRRLSLNNNLIEKIENLGQLVHLEELDLSFNKITEIKNINELVNLEILSLFENRIERIENMEKLKKLTIFSIGRNCIDDYDSVIYLRKFPELRSLNMEGNPCADKKDFRTFVATFLPQLDYYQYRLIAENEPDEKREEYRIRMRSIREVEAKEREIQEKIEAAIAEEELQSGSFVEFLGSRHLFDSLFEEDRDGKALLLVGDEVLKFYREFEENFLNTTKQIFEFGQEQYKIRQNEIKQFLKVVEGAKIDNQQQSIEHMEQFLEIKGQMFSDVKKLQDGATGEGDAANMGEYNLKLEEYSDKYGDLIHKTWKTLMGVELTLYEQMEETNVAFGLAMTEMVNFFIETSQGYFCQLRDGEQLYMENLGEAAGRFLTLTNLDPTIPIPDELEELMSDRDLLNNGIAASHDVHMQMIDSREDRLVSRARSWLEALKFDLQNDEIARDRGKVLEINHFLDIQREEFEEVLSLSVGPAMDPDISDLLQEI